MPPAPVDRARAPVRIYANSLRMPCLNPACRPAQQLRRDAGATEWLGHVDPLQFAVTSEPLRQVTGDEADNLGPALLHILRDEHNPVHQRLSRMRFAPPISPNAAHPIPARFP